MPTSSTLALVTDLAGDEDQERIRIAAMQLAETADPDEIAGLIGPLSDRDKAIRRATAHLIGEIADLRPDLFLPHVPALIEITKTGTGPAVWEALHVLSIVSEYEPTALSPYLETIATSLDGTSVIARDNGVRILTRLATLEASRPRAMSVLLRTLQSAPINQLPMYAEEIGSVVQPEDAVAVREILTDRLTDISQPAKIRRIETVLRKLPDQ